MKYSAEEVIRCPSQCQPYKPQRCDNPSAKDEVDRGQGDNAHPMSLDLEAVSLFMTTVLGFNLLIKTLIWI